jgi:integrase
MVAEDLLEFIFLTPEHVIKYLTHIRTINSRYGKPIGNSEIFKRLEVIDLLWKQGEFISNGLVIAPFPQESPYVLSGITKAKQQEQKFDFIPDAVALALGTIATDYIESKSGNILAASAAVDLSYASVLSKHSKAAANRHARKAANRFGYKYLKEVTRDIGYLRTACYIVIALFSGIRDSEISSLDVGCVEDDTEARYIWIRGHIYKTAEQKLKSRWMVPPIVKAAVVVVEELTASLRRQLLNMINLMASDMKAPLTSGYKKALLKRKLVEYEKVKHALWLVQSSKLGNEISSNKTIHQQLLVFMKGHEIPNHEGKPWSLHSHQFRRTFVRFMVKNAMNLKYLQEHFRHISLDMTAWYDIEDTELTKEIVNCYSEMSKEKLEQIVDSNNIAGKGGEIIIQTREFAFKGVISKSKDRIIKAMADTVTLRSTGVSWCLGDIENGECTGVHGCMLNPSNVRGCSQGIVTPEFLPAWQEIKFRNQDLLERDDLGVHQKNAIRKFLDTVVTPVINGIT